MLAYHVTQSWNEGDDLKAFAKMFPWNDETAEILMKRAAEMWHEDWSREKAEDYYFHRGQQLHLHETEEDARSFADEHGGIVLEIVLNGLQLKRNEENLYTEDVVPAERIRRISSD